MLIGVYSNSSNREEAKSRAKCQMSHYLKRLNVFGKLNHIESFQSWTQNFLSPTEQQALQILENNTILKNGHFETPILWKSESLKLPNNRALAKKRFQSLENKFAKSPEFSELYRKQINEYIDLGHHK